MTRVHKINLISDPVGDALSELISSYAKTTHTDVFIYTKDGLIRAHRSVLIRTSSMFKKFLCAQDKEVQSTLFINERRSVVLTLMQVLYKFNFSESLRTDCLWLLWRFQILSVKQRMSDLLPCWMHKRNDRLDITQFTTRKLHLYTTLFTNNSENLTRNYGFYRKSY